MHTYKGICIINIQSNEFSTPMLPAPKQEMEHKHNTQEPSVAVNFYCTCCVAKRNVNSS